MNKSEIEQVERSVHTELGVPLPCTTRKLRVEAGLGPRVCVNISKGLWVDLRRRVVGTGRSLGSWMDEFVWCGMEALMPSAPGSDSGSGPVAIEIPQAGVVGPTRGEGDR